MPNSVSVVVGSLARIRAGENDAADGGTVIAKRPLVLLLLRRSLLTIVPVT